MAVYEAWRENDSDGVSVAFGTQANIADLRLKGLLGEQAALLYRITAATAEEAAAIHALRMGWSPYRPAGEPTNCAVCGAIVYPEGSGQCWRCDDNR